MLLEIDHFMPGSLLVSTLEKGVQDLRVESIESDLREKYPKGIPYNYKGMLLLLEERRVYALEAGLGSKQNPTRICTLAMIRGVKS